MGSRVGEGRATIKPRLTTSKLTIRAAGASCRRRALTREAVACSSSLPSAQLRARAGDEIENNPRTTSLPVSTDCPTGKSRKAVKPYLRKYSYLQLTQINPYQ
jgi:hypothetical protein